MLADRGGVGQPVLKLTLIVAKGNVLERRILGPLMARSCDSLTRKGPRWPLSLSLGCGAGI